MYAPKVGRPNKENSMGALKPKCLNREVKMGFANVCMKEEILNSNVIFRNWNFSKIFVYCVNTERQNDK